MADVTEGAESRLERVFKPKLRNILLQIGILFLALRFGYIPINSWVIAQGGIFVIHELFTSFITVAVVYVIYLVLLLIGDELLYRYGYR